ncbi:MAG: YkgJ family cysteine cluster protein [Bacteroidales bacterium]|nr:YkgJ family cysteine cluster protein [Bacteroidales bacterium]
MSELYFDQWKRRKTESLIQNRKWLKKIPKSSEKSINEKADILHDLIFSKIDCLDCAGCCTVLPPIVNETDIKRVARFLGIKPSEFSKKYINFDENDMILYPTPCPFLESDNKCRIYEVRPRACREYPHTGHLQFIKNKHLHAINAQYCPAVFYIMEEIKKKF